MLRFNRCYLKVGIVETDSGLSKCCQVFKFFSGCKCLHITHEHYADMYILSLEFQRTSSLRNDGRQPNCHNGMMDGKKVILNFIYNNFIGITCNYPLSVGWLVGWSVIFPNRADIALPCSYVLSLYVIIIFKAKVKCWFVNASSIGYSIVF